MFFFFCALFSNFYIVHGCDFIVFLLLRSLFWSLLLLRCWAWLWKEKVMFMLCMSVLAFIFCFLMSYICFTVCLLLGLLSFCCPFGFFFSYNPCVVYVFVFSSKSNCCAMCLMAKLACTVWLGMWFGCSVECRWPLLCHFRLFHFQVWEKNCFFACFWISRCEVVPWSFVF